MNSTTQNICVIGGAGHIGLPLGVSFANAGHQTTLVDIDANKLERIAKGEFPYEEAGGAEALEQALKNKTLFTSTDHAAIKNADIIFLIIGTPIDENLRPRLNDIQDVVEKHFDYFKDGQILILRSTVYPRTSKRLHKFFKEKGKDVRVAFCPERTVQGKTFTEIKTIPQIVSAFDAETLERVKALFLTITKQVVVAEKPIEAELAKLFTNAWRYVSFAVANQLFQVAAENGLDFEKIRSIMMEGYDRNKSFPKAGFAAGPCLLKDTMQLAAFNQNHFQLGHAAMLINEGLPQFILEQLKGRDRLNRSLSDKTIGILGMAFKADNDDFRDSLSYKLRDIAKTECKRVLCSDVYIADDSFVTAEELLEQSDIIILGAAHSEYASIDPKQYPDKYFADIWNRWPDAENILI